MAMLNNQRVTFSLVTVSENTKTGWRIPWTPRLEAPNLRFDPTNNPNRPSNSFQAIPIIMGIMGIGSFYNVLLSLWLAKPSHLGYPSWSFVNRRSLLPWLFYRGSPVPTGRHINPRSWKPHNFHDSNPSNRWVFHFFLVTLHRNHPDFHG